jgi:hypothetical protein
MLCTCTGYAIARRTHSCCCCTGLPQPLLLLPLLLLPLLLLLLLLLLLMLAPIRTDCWLRSCCPVCCRRTTAQPFCIMPATADAAACASTRYSLMEHHNCVHTLWLLRCCITACCCNTTCRLRCCSPSPDAFAAAAALVAAAAPLLLLLLLLLSPPPLLLLLLLLLLPPLLLLLLLLPPLLLLLPPLLLLLLLLRTLIFSARMYSSSMGLCTRAFAGCCSSTKVAKQTTQQVICNCTEHMHDCDDDVPHFTAAR